MARVVVPRPPRVRAPRRPRPPRGVPSMEPYLNSLAAQPRARVTFADPLVMPLGPRSSADEDAEDARVEGAPVAAPARLVDVPLLGALGPALAGARDYAARVLRGLASPPGGAGAAKLPDWLAWAVLGALAWHLASTAANAAVVAAGVLAAAALVRGKW